jgi:hypothetical protein
MTHGFLHIMSKEAVRKGVVGGEGRRGEEEREKHRSEWREDDSG